MTTTTNPSARLTKVLPTVDHADGCYLFDTVGRDYLDASSGVLNVNIGHRHPAVRAAIHDQLDRVAFVHRTQFANGPAAELTAHLLEIAPSGTAAVEYSNSGSEANECALRLAFAYHDRRGNDGRTAILSEEPSYHGMTAGALSITGMPSKRDRSVRPLIGATDRILVRPRPGHTRATRGDWAEAILRVGAHRIAAIVVEPLGGASSGAAPISRDTLQWLRRETHDEDIVLIGDEVMSGFGRTGDWWAADDAGIAADITTSGKGVTGGYTSLAVSLISERIADGIGEPLGPIALGHTMSANPLACAAAGAVLGVLVDDDLPGAARRRGADLEEILARIVARSPALFSEHTGRGLMRGLHLVPDAPAGTHRRLVGAALAAGLVLCPAGISATTQAILVAPPLTVGPDDLAVLAERFEAAVRAVG